METVMTIAAAVGAALLLRALIIRPLSAKEAVALIEGGGLVIDVRSPGEYEGGHLEGVPNIPLDLLKEEIGKVAPDTGSIVLLHCASGVRSMVGARSLRAMGYTRAHNLGSFGRARRLLRRAKGGVASRD